MVKYSSSTRHHEEKEINDESKDQDGQIIIDHLDLSSLPPPWYRSHPLWSNLMSKTFDEKYKTHSNFLDAHPAISNKMRSVLCDWLIEVNQQEIFFHSMKHKCSCFRFQKFIIYIEKLII